MAYTTAQQSKQLGFAIELAREAGITIKENFRTPQKIIVKGDNTPVTDTDKKINARVIELINKEYPSHSVVAEEGNSIKNSIYTWNCDPLDGTINFTHGIPICVFSLALTVRGIPMLGVVYDPFTDRMYTSQFGKGSFLNGEKIEVSKRRSLDKSEIAFAFWPNAQFDLANVYNSLIAANSQVFSIGSITYGAALVASGEYDASLHPARMSWDSAAVALIVKEAKGEVTDLFNRIQRYDGKIKGAVLSNGFIHTELTKLTRMVRS